MVMATKQAACAKLDGQNEPLVRILHRSALKVLHSASTSPSHTPGSSIVVGDPTTAHEFKFRDSGPSLGLAQAMGFKVDGAQVQF